MDKAQDRFSIYQRSGSVFLRICFEIQGGPVTIVCLLLFLCHWIQTSTCHRFKIKVFIMFVHTAGRNNERNVWQIGPTTFTMFCGELVGYLCLTICIKDIDLSAHIHMAFFLAWRIFGGSSMEQYFHVCWEKGWFRFDTKTVQKVFYCCVIPLSANRPHTQFHDLSAISAIKKLHVPDRFTMG
mgnify:CR=1 FL=1